MAKRSTISGTCRAAQPQWRELVASAQPPVVTTLLRRRGDKQTLPKQDGVFLAAPRVAGIASGQGAPYGRLDLRRLDGERVAQPPELPPQIVDLVEQSEH